MWMLWVAAAAASPEVLRFESGLRVVIEQAEGTGWVAASVVFDDAGEASVDEGKEHLAHLVEHLWFRAGEPRSHHAALFAWGCDTQAFTWPLSMEFLATCPADVLDPLLGMVALQLDDALRGLDQLDVDIERDVVDLEVGGYRETARTGVTRAVAARLHPGSRWAGRVAREGTAPHLELAEVRAWSDRHLSAEHAVLGIVSPYSASELRPRLEARFGRVVSTAAVGPLAKPVRKPRRTLRVDVRAMTANVDSPVVVTSWEMPVTAVPISGALAGMVQFALTFLLSDDARFGGASCFDHQAGAAHVLTCAVEVAGDADVDRFARRVRAAADVREVLEVGMVSRALRHIVTQRESEPVLGTLMPIPFNRPSVLAHRMVSYNRTFDDRAVRLDTKRDAKRIQRAASEALDPQRALVLAIRPDGIERGFPAPRARATSDRSLPSVRPPLSRPARVVAYQGVLGISRPDLPTSWVLTFDGRSPTDADPIPDATAWAPRPGPQRVVIGPVVTDSAAVAGTVAARPYGAPDPVPAGVRRESTSERLAAMEWLCRVPPRHGAALLVWRELLSWRAWHVLRESTAWSYTPEVQALADGLSLSADLHPQVAEPALAAMQQELTAIAAGEVTPAELGAAIRRASVVASPGLALLPHWPSMLLGPAHLRTAEDLHGLADEVATVDLAQLQAVAGHCDVTQGWTVRLPAD